MPFLIIGYITNFWWVCRQCIILSGAHGNEVQPAALQNLKSARVGCNIPFILLFSQCRTHLLADFCGVRALQNCSLEGTLNQVYSLVPLRSGDTGIASATSQSMGLCSSDTCHLPGTFPHPSSSPSSATLDTASHDTKDVSRQKDKITITTPSLRHRYPIIPILPGFGARYTLEKIYGCIAGPDGSILTVLRCEGTVPMVGDGRTAPWR